MVWRKFISPCLGADFGEAWFGCKTGDPGVGDAGQRPQVHRIDVDPKPPPTKADLIDDGSDSEDGVMTISTTVPDGGVVTVGGRVRIDGLKSSPELNGTEGVATEWHEDTGRWTVKLATETVRVKTANVTAISL